MKNEQSQGLVLEGKRRIWVFHGTNVVLWALSGYRWRKD